MTLTFFALQRYGRKINFPKKIKNKIPNRFLFFMP